MDLRSINILDFVDLDIANDRNKKGESQNQLLTEPQQLQVIEQRKRLPRFIGFPLILGILAGLGIHHHVLSMLKTTAPQRE